MAKNVLYKGDCLIESDKIENWSVDLILTDLPYGTTACISSVVCRFESCAPNKFFISYNVKSTCDLAKFQTQIKNKHTYKNLFISLQKKKNTWKN